MPSHTSRRKNEPYKVELIEDLPEGSEISFYSQGDWTDLCAGPHLMSVKGIKAFKLLSSSSAYWRGSEKNAMLTRIYGTAYATKDELKEHLEQMEEAKRRDHNKLGREMKIFTTVDVIGQGLPLIMPNGVIIMQELQRWIEDEETKRGYIRTKTPLWQRATSTRFPDTGIITKRACSFSATKKQTKKYLRFVL